MVKDRMYSKIQELSKRGKNKTEIAKELNITRKTVKKYLNMDIGKYKKYQTKLLNRNREFETFKPDIIDIYTLNDPKKIYKSSVYDYLEEKHGKLPGTEKTLRNYINYLIKNGEVLAESSGRVYEKVPELPYGQQMQLDFGEYLQLNKKKLYIFAAVLSSSRYKFIRFQEIPFKTRDVILHLLECFDFLGGIPHEIVIDQDKLMVVSENHGDILFTKDFQYFIDEMDIKMYVCHKADPESKGKVENLVKYVKVNFLNTRSFESAEQADNSVLEWLKRRGNGKISQATKKIPLIEIEEERKHLSVIKNSIFRKDNLWGREDRIVNDNYISVYTNYYGLPGKYNGRQVEIYVTKSKLFLYDPITGEEITSYDLSLLSGKKIMHRQFKRESETSSKELKNEIQNYFSEESWKQFLENNFKTFPRFIRDQCLEARKYFKDKDIDKIILQNAIAFCASNQTFSFANLHDTYLYYLQRQKETKIGLDSEQLDSSGKKQSGDNPKIPVNKRSVEEYSKYTTAAGGEK
jgi:transposase